MRLLMYNSWNGLNTGEVVRYLRYQPGRYLVHAPYHYQTPFRTWNSKVPKTLGLGMSYNSCRFKRHWKTHLNVWQAIGKWSFVTAPRRLWESQIIHKGRLWSTRMSGARIAVSLGFRCGECQLNNCKAQRLIVQKQVSKFKTLKIRTRPVPSPLPEANPGKVPYSTLLKCPTKLALCKVAKLRSYETFAGETEQPWVHPIHCTLHSGHNVC